MTMEAPHETEPLLRTSVARSASSTNAHIRSGEYDNTPVYPIIMMIRAVSHIPHCYPPEGSQL